MIIPGKDAESLAPAQLMKQSIRRLQVTMSCTAGSALALKARLEQFIWFL